jgi:hypothetical protein
MKNLRLLFFVAAGVAITTLAVVAQNRRKRLNPSSPKTVWPTEKDFDREYDLEFDSVDEASEDSFPASDAPSFTPHKDHLH